MIDTSVEPWHYCSWRVIRRMCHSAAFPSAVALRRAFSWVFQKGGSRGRNGALRCTSRGCLLFLMRGGGPKKCCPRYF